MDDDDDKIYIELDTINDNDNSIDIITDDNNIKIDNNIQLDDNNSTHPISTNLDDIIFDFIAKHINSIHIIFSLLLLILSLLCILIIFIFPFYFYNFHDIDTTVWIYNKKEIGNIQLTKEYQITLSQDLVTPRYEGVNKILEYISKNSSLNIYNPSKHHIGIRSQYKFNPFNCTNWKEADLVDEYYYNHDLYNNYTFNDSNLYYYGYSKPHNTDDSQYLSETEIRVRNWISVQLGDGLHTSSIDIKKQVSNQTEAFYIPFEPAEDQKETATEKLEEDIKGANAKWSHKCKVTNVPYYPLLDTCRDVMKYWPNCFPNLPYDKYDNNIEKKTHSENYWWEDLREDHDIYTGLKWRLTITMEYESFAQALEGRTSPIDNPEASLRIWSTKDGSGPWNTKNVAFIHKLYHDLLLEFEK